MVNIDPAHGVTYLHWIFKENFQMTFPPTHFGPIPIKKSCFCEQFCYRLHCIENSECTFDLGLAEYKRKREDFRYISKFR